MTKTQVDFWTDPLNSDTSDMEVYVRRCVRPPPWSGPGELWEQPGSPPPRSWRGSGWPEWSSWWTWWCPCLLSVTTPPTGRRQQVTHQYTVYTHCSLGCKHSDVCTSHPFRVLTAAVVVTSQVSNNDVLTTLLISSTIVWMALMFSPDIKRSSGPVWSQYTNIKC